MIKITNKNELPKIYKLIIKTCWISWKNYYSEASINYAVKNLFCLNRLEKTFSAGQIYGISKDNKIIACGVLEVKKKIGILKIVLLTLIFKSTILARKLSNFWKID